MSGAVWRWAAGAAIVAALTVFGVLLIPHYRQNAEFERALEGVMKQPATSEQPEEILRARVMNQAARLGLEVRGGHVRVRRTDSGVRVEVRYPVEVELGPYTVTLHFRASAPN